MKLLDILAREIEDWPEGASHVGYIVGTKELYFFNEAENKCVLRLGFECVSEDTDINTTPRISKDEWQSARAAYLEEDKYTGEWKLLNEFGAAEDPAETHEGRKMMFNGQECKISAYDPTTKAVTISAWGDPPEAETQDGWIEWHGGECPVDGDAIVQTKLASGAVGIPFQANTRNWQHYDSWFDIIAYRLHREEKEEPVNSFCDSKYPEESTQALTCEVDAILSDSDAPPLSVFDIIRNDEKEDRRPPIVEGEPGKLKCNRINPELPQQLRDDEGKQSPAEAAYAAKLADKKAQHEAACLAEHVRREQDRANVLKTADPHTHLLGVGQYREGE